MNDGWTVVAVIVALVLAALAFTFQYQSCRAKFPNAPAWSCLAR